MRKKKPNENGDETIKKDTVQTGSEDKKKPAAAPDSAAAAASEASEDIPAEETGKKAETADEKKASGTEQAGKKENAAQKELSELEVLKLYLEQSIGELKRVKKEAEELKKNLDTAQTQTAQYRDKLSTVVAEYDNYRRRTTAEKEFIANDAIAKAVGKLLPALDSLETAGPYAETNPESFKKGVSMTLNQLKDGFAALGVKEIQAEGQVFNPDLHNAVMHFEDENKGENVVTEVFQKGYTIGEKVIRHAMVKVAN